MVHLDSPGNPDERHDPVRLMVVTALILLLAAPILLYPLGPDQGIFATFGRELLAGKVPYVQVWDIKPPAVYVVYGAAIAVLGETTYALRSIDLWLFPLAALCLYLIGRWLANTRVGIVGVILFAAIYFRQSFWTLTQNDGIAVVPMLLAVVFGLRAGRAGAHNVLFAFLSGMMCALALWFKYPYVLFLAALITGHVMTLAWSDGGWRNRLVRQGIAFAAGGLLIGGGGILALAGSGALDTLIETALLTSSYTRDGFNALFTSVTWRSSLANWVTLPNIAILLGWLPVARLVRRKAQGWHVIWLWFASGAAALLIQGQGFDYHFLPLLPPFALLAADLLDRLAMLLPAWLKVPAARALPALTLAAMALGMVIHLWVPALPYLAGQETQAQYARHFGGEHFAARDSLAAAEYLRARNVPRDSLYIWGFRAEIYYLTQLRPPTRFITQFPLVAPWYPQEWRVENVSLLWAALPRYVVVAQADAIPWVTGSSDDSKTLLETAYPDLLAWLQFNYVEEAQIGTLIVWRRSDLVQSAP